ncbi:MAG TPA: formylglycine-generating enzyme family protein, partial [Kofleriaceae bacterium]|nr:formylglycine-generating enzyme family protein [Kofleriaceae bacterium]
TVARRASERQIDDQLTTARPALERARQQAREAERQRVVAFAAFDRGDLDAGERAWARALAQVSDTRVAYTRATRALEAAFSYDPSRRDVRRRLGEVLFERVELAERELRFGERDELESILALYDPELAARRHAPARLRIETHPPARVVITRAGLDVARTDSLPPGSYVIRAIAEGRAPVAFPVFLRPGEARDVVLRSPPASAVPTGFVYVAPGSFLYGSRDEEAARTWFTAVPLHEVSTGAYLIERTETTYAQWIAFLETLPPDARARHTPTIGISATVQEGGGLALTRDTVGWALRFAPSNIVYTARAGDPIVYRERAFRSRQDWLRMPVSGISPEDALAYTAWLDGSGRVPRARPCSELEWERAARGADGRSFPHGERLTGQDANVDETYGRKDGGFGMDEVGSYPHAESPFGLLDMSGNVWEIVRAAHGQYVMRGGGFFTDASKSAHLANRNVITPTYRHLHLGLRVCADVDVSSQ